MLNGGLGPIVEVARLQGGSDDNENPNGLGFVGEDVGSSRRRGAGRGKRVGRRGKEQRGRGKDPSH